MTTVNRFCIDCYNEQLTNGGLVVDLSSQGALTAGSMSSGSTGTEPAGPARSAGTAGEGSNVVEFQARADRSGTRSNWLRGSEAGMATAEYAIATLAAVGFAGLLVFILRSDEVRGFLLTLIRTALALP